MGKLKQCLERLRCDLHVLYLSKKLNRDEDGTATTLNNQDGETSNANAEQSADSEKIIKDQIQNTMDFISKIEQSLNFEEGVMSPEKQIMDRRLSGHASAERRHERRRSHTVDQRNMNTTMISEIEYINILPDMDQYIDDSSFLKNSFADKSGRINKKNNENSIEVSKIYEESKTAQQQS